MKQVPFYRGPSIETGAWSPNCTWDVYATDVEPPAEDVPSAFCFPYNDLTHELVLMQALRGGNPQWGLTGGHVAEPPYEHETPRQGAIRETFEEGGIVKVRPDDLQLFAVRQLHQPGGYQRGGKKFSEQTFIPYYLAPVTEPLEEPTGDDVLDRRYFTRAEAEGLDIPDRAIIRLGFSMIADM